MTVTTLYYGPNVFKIDTLYNDSKNVFYDKNFGLFQYTKENSYMKEKIFTWKFPEEKFKQVEVEDYNISLNIVTLTGKSIFINVSSVDQVNDLMEQIYDILGIPILQQRIVYRGDQLSRFKLCKNYFEKSKSTFKIHLVLRLRGGMMHSSSGKGENSNASDVKIEMENDVDFVFNVLDNVSSEIVERAIRSSKYSLKEIVSNFKELDTFEDSKFKHILISEDKLRKDARIVKMMEIAETDDSSEWVDVITKLQILLLKKYGFNEDNLSEYQQSSQKHPECCFWVRENKSGPCKLKIKDHLPNITLKDLNNNVINLKDESVDPLVVISGSMS